MKIRFDLLELLTEEDLLQAAILSVDRFDPEPNFSKTGKGALRPATPEERAQEEARSEALIKALKLRLRNKEAILHKQSA